MKIVYYFRSQRQGVFSIEVLFSRIIAALGNRIQAERHEVNFKTVLKIWLLAFFKQSSTLYHITGDINYAALGLRGKRTLITVHDIGHYERTLTGWKKAVYKKIWFDWPLRKAACITTVSEFSRQQLLAVVALDPAKIKVVHNSYPSDYQRNDKPVLSAVPKILQIGSGMHKNMQGLMEAVTGFSCMLILVRAYDQELERALNERGITHCWYSNLTDREMYELYVESDLVFFASTYEGFGMPIVEAQATGRAVITSRLASMPEVAGEGAVLVDPLNVEEIKQAIFTLCSDSEYRNRLIEKGHQNIKRFESATIANKYLELYNQLLNNKR